MAYPRIRFVGKTSAEWAAAPTTVLKAWEAGINTTTGEIRAGDGVTEWSELGAINLASSDVTALIASVSALADRVTVLESADPPPDPETAALRYACVSYIYPATTGHWATLAANAAAGKLALALMNPDNGPGYEAKHESGGSRHTLWTNAMAPLLSAGTEMYGYIGTNYWDVKTPSSGARYRGTVAGNWRIKVADATADTISFHEYTAGGGSEASGGAVGTARSMTFAAGAGPFGIKSWSTGSSTGVTLPGGLALSTSYYLRPVGSTPALTYTLHTTAAGAIANTGKVNITDTGGGSGNGPFYIGFRRDSGTENGSTRAYQNVTAEMTRMVTLHPTLAGWFFDECSDADDSGSGFDALMDSIIAYRDANHPTLKMIINGVGHSQARSEAYDISVVENDWQYVVTRGTLTLTGQPSNAQTLTLGAKTYTLQTTLTNSDGNIKIGATTAETCSNIVAAITLGAGSGTAYAAATTAHPTCTARLGTGTTVVARTILSTAGGTVASTETMSNATWGAATLQGGASNSLVPSWQRSGAVDADRFWIMVQEDVTAADIQDVADFCVANNVGFLYMNGTSAFGALPTTGVDGFSQDDVLAAIDVANA